MQSSSPSVRHWMLKSRKSIHAVKRFIVLVLYPTWTPQLQQKCFDILKQPEKFSKIACSMPAKLNSEVLHSDGYNGRAIKCLAAASPVARISCEQTVMLGRSSLACSNAMMYLSLNSETIRSRSVRRVSLCSHGWCREWCSALIFRMNSSKFHSACTTDDTAWERFRCGLHLLFTVVILKHTTWWLPTGLHWRRLLRPLIRCSFHFRATEVCCGWLRCGVVRRGVRS